MATAVVQKYLDLAISLFVGNKSGSDNFFRLPDDWRKLTDQKVKTVSLINYDTAADAQVVVGKHVANSMYLVFWSHPVQILFVNGTALAEDFNTSFYGIYRDRAGTLNSPHVTANLLTFKNNLSTSSNYLTVTDAANPGASVETYIVAIEFE
tara:strand:+ start:160 stop:615 length:456 start_codon:yes stop_codon:yes gene_type:complete